MGTGAAAHRAVPPRGRRGRGAWAAVFAAIAVVTVTAGLAPAAVAATATTSATVALSTSSIPAGGTAKVTGTLRSGTRAIAGAAVVLQQRVAGATTWHTWHSGTTDASGRFAATTGHLVLSRDLRLRFAGTSRYHSVSSASKRLTVNQSVTVLKKPDATPIVGSALVFSGTTSGGLVGDLVHLQLAEGTAWTTVATSQVNADRTFSVKGKATVAGSQQYRVQVDGKLGAGGVATFPSLFTVSAWYYLSDLVSVAADDFYTGDPLTLAGKTYYHALKASPFLTYTAAMTFNLSYRCSEFRSTTATTDASSTTVPSHDTVEVDGVEEATADTTVGHATAFLVDTKGGFRLRLATTFPREPSGDVGWGDARILCAGKP